jgi:hypothetical protein
MFPPEAPESLEVFSSAAHIGHAATPQISPALNH